VRILLVSETFWPHIGGAEVLAAKLLPALMARGFEFLVLTQRNAARTGRDSSYAGIRIVEHSLGEALLEGAAEAAFEVHRQIVQLKREFRPDLVHLWLVHLSAALHWQTASAHPAPTLLTLHLRESDLKVRPNTLVGNTLRRIDWLAACSSPLLADVRRQIPALVPRSSTVLNGLEPTELAPAPLPWAPPVLLFVGRLHPQKGIETLLEAFARLAPHRPELSLILAGGGPLREALEQRAAALGIAERARFVGWVTPELVQPLMNQATIVVMPSRDEGLPLVGLQAAELARPLVATAAGGLADLVHHERTGLRVPVDDDAALAAALDRLLGDPALAERLGRAAREHVLRDFSWEACVNGYAELYQRLVQAWPAARSTHKPGG
jgi:glycogen synthase